MTNKGRKIAFDPKVFLAAATDGRIAKDVGRSVREFKAGSVVFAQGDPADSVFYVQRGQIKIVVTSGQGKEAVLGILGQDAFFGEGCLIGQVARLATASAITDSRLLRIERAEMVRVLHAEPKLGEVFTAYLLTRNSRIEEDLVDQLFNSSEKRLARTLLLLANFGKDGRPEPVTAKIGAGSTTKCNTFSGRVLRWEPTTSI
jgi:CRP/FNR family transcriptional regulator, cyclic AMP receptor protein